MCACWGKWSEQHLPLYFFSEQKDLWVSFAEKVMNICVRKWVPDVYHTIHFPFLPANVHERSLSYAIITLISLISIT